MSGMVKVVRHYGSAIHALIALGVLLASSVSAAPFAYVPRGSGISIAVIDLATNTIVANPEVGLAMYSVAASRATGKVFIGHQWNNPNVTMLDAVSHTVQRTYYVGGRVNGIAVTPDGSRFYVPLMDSPVIKAVDVATGTVLATIPVGAQVNGLAVTPDGGRLLVVNTNSFSISVIDTVSNTVVRTIGSRSNPMTVAINPNGTRAYVTLWGSNELQVINLNTYTDGVIPVGGRPFGVAVSPDGTRVYVANGGADTVSVIDATTNSWLMNIGLWAGAGPNGISTSVDGSAVYVTALSSGAVARIDTATNTVTDTIITGNHPYAVGIFTTGLTVPMAPVITGVTAGIGTATVNFTPSVNDGGTPISQYVVSCGSFTANTLSSPVVFSGMSNGVSYPCTMYASNEIGNSAVSNTVNVRPGQVPSAPIITATIAGDRQVTMHFDPPTSDGGMPISNYRLYCTGPGGTNSTSGPGSPITVGGLVNGVSYQCVLRAFNSIGQGELTESVKAIPRSVPDAPTILEARGENQIAYLRFQTPAANGAAISGYIGRCDGGFSATVDASVDEVRISGLSNGQTYSCRVHALNDVGESPASVSSDIVPFGPPGAPTQLSALPGDTIAVISFSPPTFDGGAPISQYIVSCNRGVPAVSGAVSPQQISGLSNGVVYKCTVRAENSAGIGPAPTAVSVIPGISTGAADLSISKTNNQVFVGGGLRTGYLITVSNPGPSAVAAAHVVDELEDYFSDAQWICTANGDAECPASGQGDLDTLVDLPAGSSVLIAIDALLAPFPEDPVSNVAAVSVPIEMSDPNLANNVASDGPDIRGIFRDEFE